jgi:hypothetical protein
MPNNTLPKTNKHYQRAGTTKRTLKTRHGQIELKLIIIHNLENNSYFRPLLLYLGISSRQRIVVDDLDLDCAETATYLTYRDSKTVIENLTHTQISKNQIHTCVQKVGNFMNQERRKRKTKDNAANAAEKRRRRRRWICLWGMVLKPVGVVGRRMRFMFF